MVKMKNKVISPKSDEDTKKLDHSHIAGENIKSTAIVKTFRQFIKIVNKTTTIRPNNCTSGHLSHKWKLIFTQKH